MKVCSTISCKLTETDKLSVYLNTHDFDGYHLFHFLVLFPFSSPLSVTQRTLFGSQWSSLFTLLRRLSFSTSTSSSSPSSTTMIHMLMMQRTPRVCMSKAKRNEKFQPGFVKFALFFQLPVRRGFISVFVRLPWIPWIRNPSLTLPQRWTGAPVTGLPDCFFVFCDTWREMKKILEKWKATKTNSLGLDEDKPKMTFDVN